MSDYHEEAYHDTVFGSNYNVHSFSTSKMDVGDEAMGLTPSQSQVFLRRSRSFPDCSDASDEVKKIKIGVCAMDKKAQSNPMKEIIKRMERHGEFSVSVFGDETILNKDVEEWPECDCLLSWHSEGFPTDKALQYVDRQRPLLVNDLRKQPILCDRRRVYRVLQSAKIPVPSHIVIDRDNLKDSEDVSDLIEEPDYIQYKGKTLYKPFVEKPANGDDHNVYIYYPEQMGGGVKKLFRKVDNKSAEYNPHHPGTIRRTGSFIYEEFLITGGTDVKVYTVGPAYAHAEARKSPVVDGKVQRTREGKEVRFPVLLSPAEKEIARLVTIAFGQKVCGFDLLRSDKGSFVCDVNGWSFVKSSYKYYDDAAGILRTIILASLAPQKLQMRSAKVPHDSQSFHNEGKIPQISENLSFEDLTPLNRGGSRDQLDSNEELNGEELRCVLVVIRHGDRTPKQKMKMKVKQPTILELFERHKDSKGKQAKLKTPAQLQELLDVTRKLLKDLQKADRNEKAKDEDNLTVTKSGTSEQLLEISELFEKLRVVVSVLEAGGHFSGINRKVQLKPLRWDHTADPPKLEEALLILKHGGVLTHAGRRQAEALGSHFRQVMYPSCNAGSGTAGGGLLRLHSTYRHDLKIYSSDEGRVQTSAAAFTKGLLALEGNSLTPILASLVNKDTPMLDSFGKGASEDIQNSKIKLYQQVTWNKVKLSAALKPPTGTTPVPLPSSSPVSPSEEGFFFEDESSDVEEAGQTTIKGLPENSLELLRKLVKLLEVVKDDLLEKCRSEETSERCSIYSSLSQDPSEWESEEDQPCNGERLLLAYDRWRKLHKSFYNAKKDQFDISKIPDIYDSVKYDAIHNAHINLPIKELYCTARILANVVVPNEYGIKPIDKLRIGSRICSQLVEKLLIDLGNTREESRTTAQLHNHDETSCDRDPRANGGGEAPLPSMDENLYAPNIASKGMVGGASNSDVDEEGEPEPIYRLSPMYALNINSPLRHVRTRIYFTSESHIHGLINVLSYGHLFPHNKTSARMVSREQLQHLEDTPEYDYLAHIVLRMFEKTQVPWDDPDRFRIEISFSPGASYNPLEVRSRLGDHTLPVQPRTSLHEADGLTLNELEDVLSYFAPPKKSTSSSSARCGN